MKSLQKEASRLAFALKHRNPFPFRPITLEYWVQLPYITMCDRRVVKKILNKPTLTNQQLNTIIRYARNFLFYEHFEDKNFINLSLIV